MDTTNKISGCIIGIGTYGIQATAYIRERVLPHFHFVAITDQPNDGNVMDESLNIKARHFNNRWSVITDKKSRSTLRKMRKKFDVITIITGDLSDAEEVAINLFLARVFNRPDQVALTIVLEPGNRESDISSHISQIQAHSCLIQSQKTELTDRNGFEYAKNIAYGLWSVLNQENALFSLDWTELSEMLKSYTGIAIFESTCGHDRALEVATNAVKQLNKIRFTFSTSIMINVMSSNLEPNELDVISAVLLKQIPDETGLLFCVTPVPDMTAIEIFMLITDNKKEL